MGRSCGLTSSTQLCRNMGAEAHRTGSPTALTAFIAIGRLRRAPSVVWAAVARSRLPRSSLRGCVVFNTGYPNYPGYPRKKEASLNVFDGQIFIAVPDDELEAEMTAALEYNKSICNMWLRVRESHYPNPVHPRVSHFRSRRHSRRKQ